MIKNTSMVSSLFNLIAEFVADERKFVTCHQEAVDSYIATCNFCGASHNDEYQIAHKPTCVIARARAALVTATALGFLPITIIKEEVHEHPRPTTSQ